jgi:hypothetical protein
MVKQNEQRGGGRIGKVGLVLFRVFIIDAIRQVVIRKSHF